MPARRPASPWRRPLRWVTAGRRRCNSRRLPGRRRPCRPRSWLRRGGAWRFRPYQEPSLPRRVAGYVRRDVILRQEGGGMAMATEVQRNDEQSRYELLVDGELVGIADYQKRGNTVIIPHTEID